MKGAPRARLLARNIPGGDPARHSPEDMLISALSACHMLWFLHFAADAGIAVQAYEDDPEALGEVTAGGAGRFLSATLRPRIIVPRGHRSGRRRRVAWAGA